MRTTQQEPPCSHTHQRAFTLLEIMLVMFLLGLVTAIVLPSLIPEDSSRKMQNEAKKFIALAQLAQEQALLTGRDTGIQKTPEGYQFLTYQQGQWQPVKRRLLSAVQLSDAFQMTILPGESIWQETIEMENDHGFQFDDSPSDNEEAFATSPDIYFWSYGATSPVEVTFSSVDNSKRSLSISLKESGSMNTTEAAL
ncbi:type II secretion system minor pseudopilin GspH [uncultured Endozoicomonas sp.]|uniref:type II secretion system minor pseudopilin GspH n=1 Tax=uncultured Endozoicomonas sp. TaxID=432652 RepID=UPI00260904E4|nr:type II secretion system minor pseudopilin GspH [uncultured Endozoicomonas sp.]